MASPRVQRASTGSPRFRRAQNGNSPCIDRFRFVKSSKGTEREDLDHVSECIDSMTSKRVVLKRNRQHENIMNEFESNIRLRHSNITRLFDWSLNTHKMLVFEQVGDVDLFDWITSYHDTFDRLSLPEQTEACCLHFGKQLRSALAHCHSQKIAHRDIKPDNVRVDLEAKQIYLIDFGLAYVKHRTKDRKKICGSVNYAPPELLFKQTEKINPYKTDVWGFGVLIFAMLHGIMPYPAPARLTTEIKIDPVSEIFSADVRELLPRLLDPDADKRTTMRRAGRHKWFRRPCAYPDHANIFQQSEKS